MKKIYAFWGTSSPRTIKTVSRFVNGIIKITFLFFLISLFSIRLNAQCSNCNSNYPSGTFSTTSASWTNVSSYIYGGEYAYYNVSLGSTYEWSTCGIASYDTQLTLKQGSNCSGTTLAYSDDFCNAQSQITWTATFTGTVTVLLSQYYCSNNSTNTSLQWRCSNYVVPCVAPSIPGFGTNAWNVACYEGNNFNTFKGFYTQTSLNFDSSTRWATGGTPSSANATGGAAYSGCPVSADNHSVSYKRQGFTPGIYTIDILRDDDYFLLINGVQVVSGGCCGWSYGVWSGLLDATSTVEIRLREYSGGSQIAANFNYCALPSVPGFGNNTWNVLGYRHNGYNFANLSGLTAQTFYGYYSNSTIDISSTNQWCSDCSPSNATGWSGCVLQADNHTVVYKRQGFPSAYYQIDLNGHDDGVQCYVNGALVYQIDGCCADRGIIWSGMLCSTSTVEFRVMEGGGGSNLFVDFIESSVTANAGVDATICSGQSTVLNGSSTLPANYTYTLTMNDSYGDGWNGGYLSAYINNSWFANYAASGYGSTATITVNPGQTIYFVYTSGSWESENTYSIARNGSTVYSAGTYPPTGTVYTNNSHPQIVNYSWTPSTALSSSTIANPTCTATTSTNYTFTANNSGCSVSDQVLVTVNTVPAQPSTIATPSIICNGVNGAYSVTNVPGVTYTWSYSGAGTISGSGNSITLNATTSGTLTVTPSNSCGNGIARTLSITLNPLSAGSHNSTIVNGCVGSNPSNLTLTGTSGGTAPYSYQWQVNGANATASTNSPNSTSSSYDPDALTTVGTFSFRCMVTDACGNVAYTNPKVFNLVADPNTPSATKSPNLSSVCPGTTLTVSNPQYGTEQGRSCGFEYRFSTDGGTNYSAWSATVPSVTAVGTNNRIQVRVISNCADGCNASLASTYSWNVNTESTDPTSILGTTSICQGNSTTLTIVGGSAGTGATPQWFEGTCGSTVIGSGSSITVSPTINTTYFARYNGTCNTTACVNAIVVVNALPVVNAGPDKTVCMGNSVTLSGTGASTYTWDYGVTNGVAFTPAATTTYTVTGTSNGCTNTDQVVVTLPTAGSDLATDGENATCAVSENGWVHFYNLSSGKLIASINSQGQDLGNVTMTSYVDATNALVPACVNPSALTSTSVMQRHWVITPTNQPTSAVLVRFPFSDNEFNSLNTAAFNNQNPNDNVGAIGDVKLSKYSNGSAGNVNNIATDNCGSGSTTLHTQMAGGNGVLSTIYPQITSVTGKYVTYEIPGFSEFWLHGSAMDSPLPVELVNFQANCAGEGKVDVTWATASEHNSANFTVEKSRDGINWTILTSVAGAGNSTQMINYSIADSDAASGVNYYRLTQTDFDGASETFNIASANCGDNSPLTTVKVYPNPSAGDFYIDFTSEEITGASVITITDARGTAVYTQNVTVTKGSNVFHIENMDAAPGMYYIQVSNGTATSNIVKHSLR